VKMLVTGVVPCFGCGTGPGIPCGVNRAFGVDWWNLSGRVDTWLWYELNSKIIGA